MVNLLDVYNLYHKSYKKNKTFILSVLFHEEIASVIFYLMNVLFIFRHYNIYILISCNDFIYNFLIKMKIPDNIIIVSHRPDDMKIWGNVNLFNQHIKNYLYLKDNNISYDYFWFSASNDVFIKTIDEELENNIIKLPEKKIQLSDTEIDTFYNDFLQNSTWYWYKKIIEDKFIIDTFINKKIIIKCNEIEGLVLPKIILEELLDFYIDNIYGKNMTYDYIMEEFYIPSYLISKYNLDYSTFTVREKWCKYQKLQNIKGLELINTINNDEQYKLLYSIKTIDRNFDNPTRLYVKNLLLNEL
jgi:hypothetical protein